MNSKLKYGIFILTPVLILLFAMFYYHTKDLNQTPSQCLGSFETFAYSSASGKNTSPLAKTLPQEPWNIETQLPEIPNDPHIAIAVETIRSVDRGVEVWVASGPEDNLYYNSEAAAYQFFVYQTATESWMTVPAQVENTDVFVERLYVTKDGSMWGRNVWPASSLVEEVPILSKYNDDTGGFEFEDDTLGIPTGWRDSDPRTADPPFWSEILLDSDEIFWVIPRQDFIYTYNPATHEVNQVVDISNINTKQAVIAPNGTIYISRYLGNPAFSFPTFSLQDGELIRFSPKNNSVDVLENPTQRWPVYSNMLADKSGRLWLGAVGWRNPKGTWKSLYPNRLLYFWKMEWEEDFHWYTPDPKPILQSSDGRIWFRKTLDDNEAWGMAWLDPQTMEGCWFTTVSTNIVEDEQNNLWMVTAGTLYKNPIQP